MLAFVFVARDVRADDEPPVLTTIPPTVTVVPPAAAPVEPAPQQAQPLVAPPPPPAPADGSRSFWRTLHPVLGWTSLIAATANATIGPRLKQDIDANKEPSKGLEVAHFSIASLSFLAWGGSLSALLADPPAGGSKVPKAHRWLGYAQIPLYLALLSLGAATASASEPDHGYQPIHGQGLAWAHDIVVITTLGVWGLTAGTSL